MLHVYVATNIMEKYVCHDILYVRVCHDTNYICSYVWFATLMCTVHIHWAIISIIIIVCFYLKCETMQSYLHIKFNLILRV